MSVIGLVQSHYHITLFTLNGRKKNIKYSAKGYIVTVQPVSIYNS